MEIEENRKVKKNVYYDADGYPEGVMPDIEYFANVFFTDKIKAKELIKDKYNTDYLYKVSVKNDKIIVKTYFVSFKGKLSFIEKTTYTKAKNKLKIEKILGKRHIKDNGIKKGTHTIKYHVLPKVKTTTGGDMIDKTT